ncbi:MAG: acyltransferase family protein [Rhizorhabdus sp.]
MGITKATRIPGIDAWRAILMLFGIAYHGTMLRSPDVVFFKFIIHVSESCRMGVFFALSGFLAAYSLQRHEPLSWLKERLASLGVVTVFGLAVLCPLTALAAFIAPEGDRLAHAFPQWYHIWFLVALLLYSPTAYLMHRLDDRHHILAQWESDARLMRYAQTLLLAVIPLISLCLMQLIGSMVLRMASPALFWQLWQMRLVIGYLPMFLLGFIVARSPLLLEKLTRSPALPGTIVAILGGSYIAWHIYSPAFSSGAHKAAQDALLLGIGSAIAPPAMMMLVMRSALSIRHTKVILKRLADASFTIYLVHLPIVIAINGAFSWVNWNELAEWTAAVVLTLLLSLVVHERLVRRSDLARLLFNGEIPRSRGADPVGAHQRCR